MSLYFWFTTSVLKTQKWPRQIFSQISSVLNMSNKVRFVCSDVTRISPHGCWCHKCVKMVTIEAWKREEWRWLIWLLKNSIKSHISFLRLVSCDSHSPFFVCAVVMDSSVFFSDNLWQCFSWCRLEHGVLWAFCGKILLAGYKVRATNISSRLVVSESNLRRRSIHMVRPEINHNGV